MRLSDFELRALQMLLDHPGEYAAALRAQAENASVVNRTYTGLSLQSDLEATPDSPAAGRLNCVLGGVGGRHPAYAQVISFNLFVREGRLVLLEGVAFSTKSGFPDEWPKDEPGIQLHREANFDQVYGSMLMPKP